MAFSFGGIAFNQMYGAAGPARTGGTAVAQTHVPGSDLTVIDVGGRLPDTVQWSIFVPDIATYESLAALQGQDATLVWPGGSHTALLIGITWQRVYPGRQLEAQATWILEAAS